MLEKSCKTVYKVFYTAMRESNIHFEVMYDISTASNYYKDRWEKYINLEKNKNTVISYG